MSECRICGAPWVRPAHAPWCARVRAWLAKRAANAARQREYRRRKREAA